MLSWVIAVVAGGVIALAMYAWREARGVGSLLPLAAMRAVALALLLALLLDAPSGAAKAPPPLVALDVSASWLRGGDSAAWRAARARARQLAADTLLLFGDSLRAGAPPDAPRDDATRAGAVADRALASGRPVILITDGEVDDATALRALPSGSRVEVSARSAMRDVAVLSLEAPRAVVSGDSADVRITLGASGAAPAGTLTLLFADRPVASVPVAAFASAGERAQSLRVALQARDGPATLAAAVTAPGDAERRNDTLTMAIDVRQAAGAVLVSSSPDFDSRFLVPVLRGAVALPTRAYYRVAPGAWRVEGTLAPVSEADVRRALREAPLALLHGDTALFGDPRAATTGALALLATTSDTSSEWYVSGAPASPVSPALAGIAWDSLPPIQLAAGEARGDWVALEAALGRSAERRDVIVGSERPRRVVRVAGSGLWRWQFRGGSSADAYATLWGSIFDWLTAERPDVRAAVPADGLVRAGERIRWRRGAGTDTVAALALRRRGTSRVDSLTLRFGPDGTVESDPLPAGVYDVSVRGGATLLAVNAARELLPRGASLKAGAIGGAEPRGARPRLREHGWPFLLALALLCVEWLLRRRLGLR